MLELVEDKYQENIIGLSREEIGDRFLFLAAKVSWAGLALAISQGRNVV